jgi:RNA polymerase sigma-70 factor, ECF subfamily
MAFSMTGPTTSGSSGETNAERELFGGDRELAARAAAGDSRAFGTLVERYQRPMAALVSRMVIGGSNSDVDDILQELFLRAWRGLPRFRGDAQFSTWLYRIAVNTAIKYKSRNKNQNQLTVSSEDLIGGIERFSETDASHHDPAELALRAERDAQLRKAIASLPEKHRVVIVLHYFESRSCEEIAEIVECSVGTVWSRLHYACKRLKSVLGEPL